MTLENFVQLLFKTIDGAANRPLSESITNFPAGSWFPTGLPPEDVRGDLEKAAGGIGKLLSSGAGEIPPSQLAKALDLWHEMHGTNWCPPLKLIVESL